MTGRRLWSAAALLLAIAAVVIAVVLAAASFPNGLSVLACLLVAIYAAWFGVRRRAPARTVSFVASALLIAGAIVLVAVEGRVLENLLILAALAGSLAAARIAFTPGAELPR